MANLKETSNWEEGIYQFEQTDWLSAGEDGLDNVPLRQLANRTVFLKDNMSDLKQEMQAFAADLKKQFAILKAQADKKIEEAIEYSKNILPVGSITKFPVYKGKEFGQWHLCDGTEFDAVKYKDLFYFLGVKKLPNVVDDRLFIRSCGPNGEDIGVVQEDTIKNHTHKYTDSYIQVRDKSVYGGIDYATKRWMYSTIEQATKTTYEEGSYETRPKNIAMAYYIKMI